MSRIEHVSDTALMVAACRAIETDRPDGFVHDPFARLLAGDRGMEIAANLPQMPVMCFGIGIRSRFIDELVPAAINKHGVDTVLSLGCGLDARPYRVDLPPGLRWIEVDFPAMLDYKSAVLKDAEPRCRMERIAADLTDDAQRDAVFGAVGGTTLMITEGLLGYLPAATVKGLIALTPARFLISDLTTPAFARVAGLDAYREVWKVRSDSHLNGLEILEVLESNGWIGLERRSYVTDVWSFAAERLKAAEVKRKQAGMPERQPVGPADQTGVHLFGRKSELERGS